MTKHVSTLLGLLLAGSIVGCGGGYDASDESDAAVDVDAAIDDEMEEAAENSGGAQRRRGVNDP